MSARAAEVSANYNTDLPYYEANMLANWRMSDLSTAMLTTDAVSGNDLLVRPISATRLYERYTQPVDHRR